jgi:hypothetical protein
LKSKAGTCVQKTLDGYRQAISAVFCLDLDYVASQVDTLLVARAYRNDQIEYLKTTATSELEFSIELAAVAGLRAVELDTISRCSDTEEDHRDWLSDRFVGLDNCIDYVVIGKGGLKRKIRLPVDLASQLEQYRLSAPIRKTQREIHYQKFYSIIGGHNFSQQFSRLSFHAFNWSTGAHGLRHRYAQDRIIYLQIQYGYTWAYALKIVAQEMGHFSVANTLTYMR